MKFINRRVGMVAAGATGLVLLLGVGGATATIDRQIGSADIRNNSIRSEDIASWQVKRAEIGASSVDSARIVNGSITLHDVHPNLVDYLQTGEQGPKGDTGQVGPTGPTGPQGAPGADSTVPGPQGAAGADGQDGVANPETDGTYHDLATGDGTEVVTFNVDCAGEKVATGGGFSVDFPQHRANVRFVGSTPADFTPIAGDPEGSVVAHGWEVQVINDGPATSLRTWVACATVD